MSMTEPRPGYHGLIRSDVLHLVPDGKNRVLDVGGGIGANGKYLKEQGKCSHYVVVDLVAGDVIEGVDAKYHGDLSDTGLLDRIEKSEGCFDCILCLDVLEHLQDPWSLILRLQSMLAKDGAIVVSLPNMRHFSLTMPLVLRGEFDLHDAGIMDRTHLRWFTKKSAVQMLTSSGLVMEKSESRIYRRRHRVFNMLTFHLFEEHLAQQIFFRVRRA